ncbi:Ubiquitin-binding domain-containing protein [Microdochium nivale]|nr:Ubiquitin-binding domain-containing protein [Microdochium nivale]
MGCCFSRPAGPNAPYPGDTTSARAIDSQPPLHAGPTIDSGGGSRATPTLPTNTRSRRRSHLLQVEDEPQHHQQQHGRRRREQQPLSEHIDKPLRRHTWSAKKRPWTRTALDTERTEFFDTRVTGRAEVWQVIRIALEVLWEAERARPRSDRQSARTVEGEAEEGPSPQGDALADGNEAGGPRDEAEAEALATAQGILRAAEVTLPTGNLSNGVYDSLGNYYSLPEWIVCDPVNVAEDSGSRGQRASSRKDAGDDDNDEGEPLDSDVDENEAERRREEKGKGVAVDSKDLVPVRARLSESGRDFIVRVAVDESVRSLARKIADESNLPADKRIRVAYMGKILGESTTLDDQGWQKGHIVNAFVFNR